MPDGPNLLAAHRRGGKGGAGKGALFVPEQFAGEEVFGERRAVETDEGALFAFATEVDGPGDEFFSDAALSADEDGRLGGGGSGDLLLDLHHSAALADDLAGDAQLLAELQVLVSNLGQVLRQFVAAFQVGQCHGDRIGDGKSEFQIVRIGNVLLVGRVEVYQSDDFSA